MINIDDIKIERYFSEDISEDNQIVPRFYEVDYLNKEKKIKMNISNEEYKASIDCIIGKWFYENDRYSLYLTVNVDGKEKLYDKLKERNEHIRNDLPKIIKCIVEGDYKLFIKNKNIEEAEVFIRFNSMNDEFYKVENWGKINKYKNFNSKKVNYIDNVNYTDTDNDNLKDEIIIATLKHHIEIYLISKYGRGIIYFIRELNIGYIRKINNLNKTYEVIVLIKLSDKNNNTNNNGNNINLKATIDENRIFMKEYK